MSELETIKKITREAGAIIMPYFRRETNVKIKNNDAFNFLTEADTSADEYIIKALHRAFPADQILTEESEQQSIDYAGRVWIVDPLDGTKEFINNGDRFSVMIGLCQNGVPMLGVTFGPATGEMYWAQKGQGAFMCGKDNKTRRLRVNDVAKIEDARILMPISYGEQRSADEFLTKLPLKGILYDSSFGLRVGEIGRQKAEFFVNTNLRASKWDTCAPQIILEEAGGKFTNIFGKPLDYKQSALNWKESFIATNGAIHNDVIQHIKGIEKLF